MNNDSNTMYGKKNIFYILYTVYNIYSVSISWSLRHRTNRNNCYSLIHCGQRTARAVSPEELLSQISDPPGLVRGSLSAGRETQGTEATSLISRLMVWLSFGEMTARLWKKVSRRHPSSNACALQLTRPAPVYGTVINWCHCNAWWYCAHIIKVTEGGKRFITRRECLLSVFHM